MELEEIRSYTIQALRRVRNGIVISQGLQISTLKCEVDNSAGRRMDKCEEKKFLEVLHNLLIEGVIMWGHEVDPMGWGPPWITITTYGEKVLETNKTIPHDPDGYLNNFKEAVPAADNLIQVYLAESLQTFNHNNLFASMVMLGVASEAAFEVLWSTLKSKYNRKERFERLDNKPLKTKFDEVIKELELIKNKLPKEIKENIDTNIKGIFTLIRTQRNDFGHPTGKYINRFQMFAYLQLFTGYCKALYDLNSYFEDELVNDDQRRAAE